MIEQYWEPFRSDEMLTLVTSAFKLFTAGLIYVFNSADNTKLPYKTLPPTQYHNFFRNLPPLFNDLTSRKNPFPSNIVLRTRKIQSLLKKSLVCDIVYGYFTFCVQFLKLEWV